MNNLPPEAKLWGDLYALMCLYSPIRNGLASISDQDKYALDNQAEKIIADSGAFQSAAGQSGGV